MVAIVPGIVLNTAANGLVFIIGDFGLVFGHFRLFNKKGGFMGGGVFFDYIIGFYK